MANQLWGTYSVADHCVAYAFVADLVLYDRLVVPVPDSRAEADRWTKRDWRPDRQARLLAELGDYVSRVEWTPELRERWEQMGKDEEQDAGSLAAQDLEMTADGAREVRSGRVDPYGDTRFILARDVGADLLGGADARVLSVYAQRDRFDRHWRVTKTFPFLRRDTEVDRPPQPRAVEALDIDEQKMLADR